MLGDWGDESTSRVGSESSSVQGINGDENELIITMIMMLMICTWIMSIVMVMVIHSKVMKTWFRPTT